MAIAANIQHSMASSSWIRKMFEEGNKLRAEFGADNVYDFSLGNPDLEPPAEVIEAIRSEAALTEKGAHGYMPNAGYPFAREAMAKKVSLEQGVPVEGKHLIMSVGAAGALNSVLKAILNPGDEVLVSAPFFAEYTHYCANHGGVLKQISAKADFSLDVPAIAAAITNKTAAVLINSPNNPSGKIYSAQNIRELCLALQERGKKNGRLPYLIADEPYREITYGGKTVAPVFAEYNNTVIVSSFAKNLSLPGERIGYIAINPACDDFEQLSAACIFATRVLGYVNAPAFFQRVVARSWDAKVDYSSYESRRDMLCAALKSAEIEYVEPEGAFYLFCRVPAPGSRFIASGAGAEGSDIAFCAHLKNFHILGVPGTGFGTPGYFRLAYCVSAKTIENCTQAFADAAKSWRE